MSRVELPASVIANLGAFGEAGERWAQSFPATLAEVLRRHGLTLEAPYADLSYHFVARVRRGSEPLVLKLGVPGEELAGEIEALGRLAGRGMVKLIDADSVLGAMLLERVEPGRMLAEERDDDRAMAVAAELLQSLWREAPAVDRIRSVARWGRAVADLIASGGSPHLDEARLRHAHTLLSAQEPPGAARLLHADFHQYNVLQRDDGSWVAIDPKGAVGDRGYDLWALMINCLDCDDPVARLRRRAHRLEREVGLSADRILQWTLAGAVLSAAWSLEDEGPGVAAALARIDQVDAALRGLA